MKPKKPAKLAKGRIVYADRFIPLPFGGIPLDGQLTVIRDDGERLQVSIDRHPGQTCWVDRDALRIPV